MDALERVKRMQGKLTQAQKTLDNFENYLEKFESEQTNIHSLIDYYGQDEWHQDRQIFNDPVLGEDSVNDLLIDNHQLTIKMLEIATKIIKKKQGVRIWNQSKELKGCKLNLSKQNSM